MKSTLQEKFIIAKTIGVAFAIFLFQSSYAQKVANSTAVCSEAENHISCFTSVVPGPQTQNLILPKTHAFQVIFEEAQAYTVVNGNQSVAKGNNDFTAFVGADKMTNSTKGYLSINHETDPGGVSMLEMAYDKNNEKCRYTTYNTFI